MTVEFTLAVPMFVTPLFPELRHFTWEIKFFMFLRYCCSSTAYPDPNELCRESFKHHINTNQVYLYQLPLMRSETFNQKHIRKICLEKK